MTLKTDIDQLATDVVLVHSWMHGGTGTVIMMGGAPVRSPAKLIADQDAAINTAAAGVLAQSATQAGIATTQAGNALASAVAAAASASSVGSPVLFTPSQGLTTIQQANARANINALGGGAINNTPIGAVTPSTAAFTSLSASGATNLSATNTTTLVASARISGPIVEANAGLASQSAAQLMAGDAAHTGMLGFYALGGNRQGYIGYSATNAAVDSGTIPYVAGTHAFSGAVTVGGGLTSTAGTTTLGTTIHTGTQTSASFTTGTEPAYVKGGQYFNTTLNKMRIGGATAWETVTSA